MLNYFSLKKKGMRRKTVTTVTMRKKTLNYMIKILFICNLKVVTTGLQNSVKKLHHYKSISYVFIFKRFVTV